MYRKRALMDHVRHGLTVRRGLVVQGPRQSGKSTLLKKLAQEQTAAQMHTLDDPQIRQAISLDPTGFLASNPGLLALDEVQRGGDDLLLAIKFAIDEADNAKGMFLLAGSANFLTLPKLSESLAGRVGIATLWPFSQAELEGTTDTNFVDLCFDLDSRHLVERFQDTGTAGQSYGQTLERMVRGGYPEVMELEARDARLWFSSYVETVVKRDLVEYAGIQKTDAALRLVRLLAARTGSELVAQNLAQDLGLQRQTLGEYLAWLEMVFLTVILPSWSKNLSKRVVKRPKTFLSDPGLACHLTRQNVDRLLNPLSEAKGALFETFVVTELLKLRESSSQRPDLSHLRTQDQVEVDVVMEDHEGRIVGIEVKAGQTVSPKSIRHLQYLRQECGEDFALGVVVYGGSRAYPLDGNIIALPVSALWA